MHLTLQGLVLRVTTYNDTDALLTVLTHHHGRITLKARGLRRKNSPLSAPCQLLSYAEFTVFEYRGMYTINEATSLELFHNLRRDLSKLSLGTYFAQVAEVLCQEDAPDSELLPLVLNCLYGLSELDICETKVKAVFELRCACLAGYMPDLSGCANCGNTFPDRFNIVSGQLECSKCASFSSNGIRMPVTTGVLEAMRYICTCFPKQLFSFHLNNESLGELSHITESYLSTQLERGFSTLDFYKVLLVEDVNAGDVK